MRVPARWRESIRAAWAPVVRRVRSTGVLGPAGEEHFLDGEALGGEGLAAVGAQRVETGADRLAVHAGGVGEALDVPVEHESEGA